MRKITFTPGAYTDYLSWLESDRKLFLKITDLIREAAKNPGEGTGKPELLKHEFRGILRINDISQEDYWKEIENILLAVFVPGFCNNMLDRAALQYMGLGCPIITTDIPEYLPYYEKPIAGKHYIKCNNDYSDLISIIKSYQTFNRHKLQEIGENAKELFQRTCTPVKIGQWIAQNL